MPRSNKGAWIALLLALSLPLLSMAIVPLYDTSEPRYAEIARIMASTHDWITPWFGPGIPFWGKPPLSFWAQALSMNVFGYNEFAARLPSWLCLLMTNGFMLAGISALRGHRIAVWSALVYNTCAVVYITSGAVLTDPFFAMGTTLSMISFARCIVPRGGWASGQYIGSNAVPAIPCSIGWQYGFFVGLSIGLLAKGPLAAVVIGGPVALWYALDLKRREWTTCLPWIRGLILAALLSVPWYILAEFKTPGFLDYFIVGEHIRRYLDPGWHGDLYGKAHVEPYGMIAYFWLQATFPWGLLTLGGVVGAVRSRRIRSAMSAIREDPLRNYWLAWALFTPVFFTFSANILWTYLLPAIAPFSILTATIIEKLIARTAVANPKLLAVAAIVPAAILVLSLVAFVRPEVKGSERGLVHYAAQHDEPALPLLYLSKLPFSARFYSAGRAEVVSKTRLAKWVARGLPFFLAVPKDEMRAVADLLGHPLESLYVNDRYILVEVGDGPDADARDSR
ncbi:glycosyltransferase family 39 protein [Parapusillimonas sp. SGNA-6]|nr:glycosyltransferase family 39 protein [Parapusillimonas sp. SGNA-6]